MRRRSRRLTTRGATSGRARVLAPTRAGSPAQYYASVVDPRAFGGGNKVLHDGRRWRHTPVRLAVYVAADEARIERALAASEPGRRLVENGWLHLFRLADDGAVWARSRQGGWRLTPSLPVTTIAAEPPPATPRPRRVVEFARMQGTALAMILLALAVALRARYLG